jgi:hypothetical protein
LLFVCCCLVLLLFLVLFRCPSRALYVTALLPYGRASACWNGEVFALVRAPAESRDCAFCCVACGYT